MYDSGPQRPVERIVYVERRPPSNPDRGLSIASFVLGICACVCCGLWPLAFLLALIGFILGCIAWRRVLARFGIGFSVLSVVLVFVVANARSDSNTGSSSAGGQSAVEPQSADLPQVLKVGAGPPDQLGDVWVSAIMSNGSDQMGPVTVTFAAYDSAGSLLDSERVSSSVRAESDSAAGTILQVPTGRSVAKYTATVAWIDHETDKDPAHSFTVSDVNYQPSTVSGSVTVQVTSHFTRNLGTVEAQAVCFDAAGRIVGGGEDFIDSIGGGHTIPETIHVGDISPASCSVYVMLTSLSGLS